MTRLRDQLEGGTQAALAGLVVAFALVGSHIQPWNFPELRSLRTLALLEVALFGAALVVVLRVRPRLGPGTIAAAAFVGLALLSIAWTPLPGTTADRAVGFAALLATAWLLALAAEGRPAFAAHVLFALLAGTTIVALLGVFELWHAYDQAVLPATTAQGARYNGIGQNPNQIAMLLAVVLPIALWALRTWRGRALVVAASSFALLLGSLVASGSRGAIIGAFAGCAAYLAATTTRRRRLAIAGAALAFVVAVVATQIPQPADENPPLYETFGKTPKLSRFDVNNALPLESEFGFPGEDVETGPERTLFFTSGRLQAWELALRQAAKRPLLGYGFGTEDETFVDRSYTFVSRTVENSYLGVFLQLGVVGLALLLAALALPLVAWVRALGTLEPDTAEIASVAAGVVVAGGILALPQSYLASAGSPPTAAVWIALFLLTALVAPRRAEA